MHLHLLTGVRYLRLVVFHPGGRVAVAATETRCREVILTTYTKSAASGPQRPEAPHIAIQEPHLAGMLRNLRLLDRFPQSCSILLECPSGSWPAPRRRHGRTISQTDSLLHCEASEIGLIHRMHDVIVTHGARRLTLCKNTDARDHGLRPTTITSVADATVERAGVSWYRLRRSWRERDIHPLLAIVRQSNRAKLRISSYFFLLV